jgi:hypothetical protein
MEFPAVCTLAGPSVPHVHISHQSVHDEWVHFLETWDPGSSTTSRCIYRLLEPSEVIDIDFQLELYIHRR